MMRLPNRSRVAIALLAALGACGGVRAGPSLAPVRFDAGLEARVLAMTDQRRVDTIVIDAALASSHRETRARAALAIGQVKARVRYPQLRALLLDGDTAIAANAAFALGIGKDSGAVLVLARALGGAPDAVAREAAWSLGELGETARTVLTVALGDRLASPRTESPLAARSGTVQAMALLALAKLRPVPASALRPWLASADPEVARAAAYVVGRVRPPGAISALLPLSSHRDEEVRQHVARALIKSVVGDSLERPAKAALIALLADPSERVRVNAVRSASTFGVDLRDEIAPLMRDPAPNVRVATAEGLADVFRTDATRWRAAWDADSALAVRRLILSQIRRVGVSVEAAANVEQRWAVHPDWRYRVASLGEATPNARVDSARARALSADTDPRVARAARQRLGVRDSTARRERPTAPTRPLAEYESLVKRWVAPGAAQPRAVIETDYGRITLELFGREAPLVTEAFLRLAQRGFYRDGTFHRVVPNFVVQDGEGSGTDTEAAAFTLRESWTRQRHGRGCLGLATSGPDTGGSQYYLCHSPQPHLDGAYTVFGRVVEGLDVMDKIVQGDRMQRVRVP